MENGYPTLSDILTYIAAEGVEEITEGNNNFREEFMQYVWSMLNRTSWAGGLGVYLSSATTFNVRGGSYLYKGTPKTYTPGSDVNPTDNDTTYIWMEPDNTIDSGIDGDGWPTTEHIKLASIVVDADGKITSITDLRGQAFAADVGSYVVEAATPVQVLPSHWDCSSPADNDEIHMPFYAQNSAGEKTEYARLVIKLTDVTNATEDSEVSLMMMVGGTLTDIGSLVGLSATQTLTNKTLTTPTINSVEAGSSAELLSSHWDSPSPADDDEIHIPFYAENSASEKIEYARLVIKLTDVSDGTEDAEMSLMMMVAGTLTDIGKIVGTSATQTLTNKTLVSPVITTPSLTRTIEAHTANDTLTAAESGSIHTNLNATGAVTLTLPASAAAGIEFTFAVQTTQELRVDPGTATIRDDSGQTADKYKTANAIGECITLVSDSSGNWVTTAKNGTWTEEA